MTKDKPCAVFDLYIKVDQVIIATQTDALTNIRSNTISAEVVSIFERTLLVEAVARAVAKGFPFVETSKKDISIHGDGPAPLEKAIELACAQERDYSS